MLMKCLGFDTRLALFKPVGPQPPQTVFAANRGESGHYGDESGVSDDLIQAECPQMTINTSLVPLCISQISLQ